MQKNKRIFTMDQYLAINIKRFPYGKAICYFSVNAIKTSSHTRNKKNIGKRQWQTLRGRGGA